MLTAELETTTSPVTVEEYRLIPEGRPYYELEQGRLIEMASPKGEHQDALSELLIAVRTHVKQNQLGRVWLKLDTELPNGNVYIPDLVYLSSERVALYDEEIGNIIGAPDLVVEILSRHDHARDTVQKFRSYQESGVRWYWIVDPTTLIIEEYELHPEGYLSTARVSKGESFTPRAFPGLTIDLAALTA